MASLTATDLIVNKQNLGETALLERNYPESLAYGDVLLEIDHFAFTANNITYAVLGDRMNYWKFFPAPEGYGIVPVWGYANVVASNHPEVKPGQRFYGYYPMSTHLLVKADKVSEYGFVDAASHRNGMPAVYNYYSHTANDPAYNPAHEAFTCLYRPLFFTSFLIDNFLLEQSFFGAEQLLLTSASSKTAQALASLVANRKKEASLNIKLVGLTSNRNVDFVKSLGWYDQVVAYDDLAQMSKAPSVIVDFSGSHAVQYELQTVLGELLNYNCRVGLADWQHLKGEKPLPNKGEMFFAPTHMEKRQQEWGRAGLQQRMGKSWLQFITEIGATLTISESKGPEALKRLYSETLQGKVDPGKGHMGSMRI